MTEQFTKLSKQSALIALENELEIFVKHPLRNDYVVGLILEMRLSRKPEYNALVDIFTGQFVLHCDRLFESIEEDYNPPPTGEKEKYLKGEVFIPIDQSNKRTDNPPPTGEKENSDGKG